MITFRTSSGKSLHVLIGQDYEKIEGLSSLDLPTTTKAVKQIDILSSDTPIVITAEQRLPVIRATVFFDYANTTHRWLQQVNMEGAEVSIRIDGDSVPLFTVKGVFSEAPVSSEIDSADKTNLVFNATEKPVWT